jgi:hypothetical protein
MKLAGLGSLETCRSSTTLHNNHLKAEILIKRRDLGVFIFTGFEPLSFFVDNEKRAYFLDPLLDGFALNCCQINEFLSFTFIFIVTIFKIDRAKE